MHTPGPWIAVANGSCFNLIEEGSDAHHAILIGMTYNQPGEHEANARLIAAAPDLLEALDGLIGLAAAWAGQYQAQMGWTNIHENHQKALDDAQAAIAKARDES